jgi:threonine/homoserine efflux transporter RhtA
MPISGEPVMVAIMGVVLLGEHLSRAGLAAAAFRRRAF